MEKAATSGRNAGHCWKVSLLPGAALALAGLAAPAFATVDTMQLARR